MTPAARLSAAIEVLADIDEKRRPAPDALKEWGLAHRFAGSGDRSAIASLVYDTLRRKASSGYLMGEETPRARLLGMLKLERGLDADAVSNLADGARFAPAPLSDAERGALAGKNLDDAPPHVVGDYPEWLDTALMTVFGESRAEEGAAMSARAPIDLRVNTLLGDRESAQAALEDLKAEPTRWSPWGLRIKVALNSKSPAIHAEPAFIKGQIEIQDEGSQLAALFANAKPGQQVIDLCAGGGGKTLALAAAMENKGQLYATDTDKRRLASIHDRLARSSARNVQVRTPKSVHTELDDLDGRMDLVLIDAPCTGTGSWRRNPDAKWRLRPGALEIRIKDQIAVLDRAVPLVKAGGRIAYITCSVLADENAGQVRAFLARHEGFSIVPPAQVAEALGERAFLFKRAALLSDEGILMTPRRTDTDGFFVSVLKRG